MLFVLSGNIQTGKTRFLCDLLKKVRAAGTIPFGVVAPGVWRGEEGSVSISGGYTCPEVNAFDWESAPAGKRDKNGFEKLGICNTLIPDERTMLFALRRDIAQSADLIAANAQSEKAKLLWYAFDDAIKTENAHFAKAKERGVLTVARETSGQFDAKQALLVVDELGRMELCKDSGLTEAMALLEAGPQEGCPHALVVAREQLSGLAELRFGHKWNGYVGVYPDNEDSAKCLLSTLRVSLKGLNKSASIRE